MKRILIEYIIKNKKNFIILCIFFIIGFTIGIFLVNNSSNLIKIEIHNYISSFINNLKDGKEINRIEMLSLSIKENALLIILTWFLGCTIIGGIFIYFLICYKGFTIGYTIASLIVTLGLKNGIIISIISILLQNIIFLPAFFLIAESRY